jgi:hypothetical protein
VNDWSRLPSSRILTPANGRRLEESRRSIRASRTAARGRWRQFAPMRSCRSPRRTCVRASDVEWRQRADIGSLRSDRRTTSAPLRHRSFGMSRQARANGRRWPHSACRVLRLSERFLDGSGTRSPCPGHGLASRPRPGSDRPRILRPTGRRADRWAPVSRFPLRVQNAPREGLSRCPRAGRGCCLPGRGTTPPFRNRARRRVRRF